MFPQNANTRVIDALVVAYNARDARKFADFFAETAVHGVLGSDQLQVGREAIYQRYVEVFRQYPENATQVVHRIVIGDYVIDHEKVKRTKDSEPFDVVAINTVKDGLIRRLDFVR